MGKLYLLFLPVVNAFNLSGKFTLPFLISVLSVFALLIKRKSDLKLKKLDYIFIFLIFLSLVSLGLNLVHIDQKMINHQIAFIIVILFFYFIPYHFINLMPLRKILKYLYSIYVIAMIFAISEFIDRNLLNTNLSLMIPRASVEFYEPTFWGIYFRSRSFFEESGHFASYLAVILPFMLIYLRFFKPSKYSFYLFLGLLVLTSFSMFSTAFIIFIFIGMLVFLIKNASVIQSAFIFLLLFGIFLFFSSDLTNFIDSSVIAKFESNSYTDRATKFENTLYLISNSSLKHLLFGYGLGSYEYLGIKPSVSVYINFLRDIGIVGLSGFISAFVYSMVYISKNIKSEYKDYLYFSLIMAMLFFLSIGNYFYPHFWITFILIHHKELHK